MGILNTQRISSVVPGTATEEIFIEATEYSPGKFCCDVDSIGEQLGIDRAIALSYHVNGEEAEFITYGENIDDLKLKFYPGMTIVVSEYHSPPSQIKSPASSKPMSWPTHFSDQHDDEFEEMASVVPMEGEFYHQEDDESEGTAHEDERRWRHPEGVAEDHSKMQTIRLVSSSKEEHIAAHAIDDGYYCNVFDIEQQLGLDPTRSRTYTVRGRDAEFMSDESDKIDCTKIKFYPSEVVEISEYVFAAPTGTQPPTVGSSSSSSSWDSEDSDSPSTGCSSIQEVPHVVDEDAENEVLNLLENHKQGTIGDNLRVITLSLTGAPITYKAFDVLVTLPCLEELNIALAWTFRRRDLNAVVEKLNQLSVHHLTLNFKDKRMWKRPQVFGHNGQPLEAFRLNPKLRSFHLIGAGRFEIRVDPEPDQPPSNLKELHLQIPIDDKYDQAAVQNIIKLSPLLVDLRLGGIYKSEMHEALAGTIGELKLLEVLHLYGMERNELGGPILDLLGGVTSSAGLLRELVLVNSNLDAIETQALVRKCEHSLTALVLDHAVFQPLNLKFFCNKPSSRPMLRNLTSLHLHVYEGAESVRMLARILEGLSLTHLGLTQSDPTVVRAQLDGKSLLHYVKFGSMKSLFLSGFTGPCLVPLWESVGLTSGNEGPVKTPRSSVHAMSPLEYLSIEYVQKCPDLLHQLRQFNLKSLWIVANVKALECDFAELALGLDYSSLEKMALFRVGARGSPKLDSYFWGLEGHLVTHGVKDLTIRVGDFEEKGGHGELSGHKMLTYVVDKQGELRHGPRESACKDINPRYHRYRWGMAGWSV
ncbi:hypothetical protein BGZ70_002996 [Mortierella alpina]|uniref:Uncharacterized protein n=1 Tax=Mortierella alpina TaxID=64518 RepID=A0A9P6ITK0_MORAP|nr:hypothetical protein BGZ70_002996 [Mortierella alpina]